jgi:integrase
MNKPRIFARADSPYWWFSWVTDDGRVQKACRADTIGIDLYHDTYSRESAQLRLLQEFGFINAAARAGAGVETVSDMIRWLDTNLPNMGIAGSTVTKYMQAARRMIEAFGPHFPVANITRVPHVAVYQDTMFSRGVKPSTVNSQCQQLQSCFAKLVDRGLIPSNPFTGYRRLPESGVPFMTADEIRRFFAAMREWQPKRYNRQPEWYEGIKRLMYIYFYTARRRTEPLNTRREDIDLERGVMAMPNVKKRGKPRILIEIPPEIEPHIRWFLETYPARTYPFGAYKPDNMTRYAKIWIRAAGLSDRYNLHTIRHSALSLALEGGTDIRLLQEIADHSTLAVTERYLHTRRRGKLSFLDDFSAQE